MSRVLCALRAKFVDFDFGPVRLLFAGLIMVVLDLAGRAGKCQDVSFSHDPGFPGENYCRISVTTMANVVTSTVLVMNTLMTIPNSWSMQSSMIM